MTTLLGGDGTRLAYRVTGTGPPLICLPGGPMRDATYLGDLGGLSSVRELVILDLRGTGASQRPRERGSYRCDRQAEDVEALRRHLGLDRMDILAHSAGASLAVAYVVRHAGRIGRLVLVTPSSRAVGLPPTEDAMRAAFELRRDEPWFTDALAALERISAGQARPGDWEASRPLSYGRWDAAAQAHAAADRVNREAAREYYADGAFDPEATRAAIAALPTPVLLLAGGYDAAPSPDHAHEYAALFGNARVVVQARAGHYPWLDDADAFVGAVSAFLS